MVKCQQNEAQLFRIWIEFEQNLFHACINISVEYK